MEEKTILIKKYENRRLYDTTNSRYINLDEIAQLIREGRELQVVDAATGEDLTRTVLTQIIMEQAKEPGSAFPLDVLRQMVVASGRATQESALKYMRAMFDLYQNAYRVMSPPINPFDFMQGRGTWPPASEESVSSQTPRADHPREVDELKRRIEELESLVSKSASKKKAPRRSRSKSARTR